MAELSVLHFRSLRATLSSLQENAGAGGVDAHQLRLQLDRSRAPLRRILDKLPPSSREKEELEKGGCMTLVVVVEDSLLDRLQLPCCSVAGRSMADLHCCPVLQPLNSPH